MKRAYGKSFTRRHAVKIAGIGLMGATSGASAEAMNSQLRDPVTTYPRPPFKRQSQPWPGLASKMEPPPDHGEESYRGAGRLAGRKALITGGDSGMGRAAAIAYAREGADVAINYLPVEEPDARDVIALIKAAGRTGLAIAGDVRDEAFCQELVARAVEGLGGLDIVVNNAGRQQTHASILEISTEQFDWTMKTNIYAPFWIIKAALPHLKPGSVIIGTASEQAYDPSPDLYDYAQTKAATMNYVKSLAKQLGPRGIRVNAVAPGPIWTPLQVTQLVAARTGMSQADAEKRVDQVVAEAKTAADNARRGAAHLSFWLTAALLFGAFAASLAAAEGGMLRDGRWNDRVLTPRAI